MPAVEAAACGTPVIATTESPLPELLEGGGFFVEPGSLDALTGAMRRLLDDDGTRDAMGRQALLKARALSWAHGAELVHAALVEAAGQRQLRAT